MTFNDIIDYHARKSGSFIPGFTSGTVKASGDALLIVTRCHTISCTKLLEHAATASYCAMDSVSVTQMCPKQFHNKNG
jgi:hypothetical protein